MNSTPRGRGSGQRSRCDISESLCSHCSRSEYRNVRVRVRQRHDSEVRGDREEMLREGRREDRLIPRNCGSRRRSRERVRSC